MEFYTDIIIYYIRMFIINMCVYYSFEKILNIKENRIRNNIVLAIVNIILLLLYVPIKTAMKSFLPFIVLCVIYASIISKLTRNKIGHTMIIIIISYAIVFIFHTMGIILQFIPYKMLYKLFHKESMYLSLTIISIFQVVFTYLFFKIRRFKNGFSFLNNRLSNEITDIIMLNISAILIIIYCLFEIGKDQTTMNLFATILVLSYTMYMSIHKMLTMHYKQKLLTDTMEEYKKEIDKKQNEIDILKQDKKNVSQITHEFYNRQVI